MKKFHIFIILIFAFHTAFAQQEQKAKDILDKVSAKTKSYKTFKAEFTSTLENLQEDIKETYKGTIFIKGAQYKLLFMGAEIFSDGNTIWTYLTEEEEVNINEPNKEDESFLSNPTKIFTIYEKDFKYKFVNEKFQKGRALYEIDLFPIKRDKAYSRIKLKIDKTKMQIFSIKYYGKDGNHYTIEILKFTPDIEMNDKMFIFNEKEHPDVEVIDMRE